MLRKEIRNPSSLSSFPAGGSCRARILSKSFFGTGLKELVEVFTGKKLAKVSLKDSQAFTHGRRSPEICSLQRTSPRLGKITFRNTRGKGTSAAFLWGFGIPSSWKQYSRRSGEDVRCNFIGLIFIWLALYQQAC